MKDIDEISAKKADLLVGENSDVKDTDLSAAPALLPEDIWEKMYKALLRYRFGHIDFLSLLDEWEELLHIKSRPPDPM